MLFLLLLHYSICLIVIAVQSHCGKKKQTLTTMGFHPHVAGEMGITMSSLPPSSSMTHQQQLSSHFVSPDSSDETQPWREGVGCTPKPTHFKVTRQVRCCCSEHKEFSTVSKPGSFTQHPSDPHTAQCPGTRIPGASGTSSPHVSNAREISTFSCLFCLLALEKQLEVLNFTQKTQI